MFAKAKAGKLSRIDYVVAIENIEFDTLKKHNEIASVELGSGYEHVLSNLFKTADGKRRAPTLDDYLNDTDGNHLASYAVQWNYEYYTPWERKHPDEKSDEPMDELTKSLKPDTTKYIQRAIGAAR